MEGVEDCGDVFRFPCPGENPGSTVLNILQVNNTTSKGRPPTNQSFCSMNWHTEHYWGWKTSAKMCDVCCLLKMYCGTWKVTLHSEYSIKWMMAYQYYCFLFFLNTMFITVCECYSWVPVLLHLCYTWNTTGSIQTMLKCCTARPWVLKWTSENVEQFTVPSSRVYRWTIVGLTIKLANRQRFLTIIEGSIQ